MNVWVAFVFVVLFSDGILLRLIRLGLFSGVDLSGSILLGGFSWVDSVG